MRVLYLLAAAASAITTMGYVVADTRKFVNPMMAASFDDTAKLFLRAAYYLPAVDFALATLVLLMVGTGRTFGLRLQPLVPFIGLQFLVFAVVQVGICLGSGVQGALVKIVPWMLFLAVAVLVGIGVATSPDAAAS